MASNAALQRYSRLLNVHVAAPGEEHLAAAADLGRELLLDGVPIEDVVEIHEIALGTLAQDCANVTPSNAVHRTTALLMETLMAYGLALRERDDARQRAQQERERLIAELQDALAQVKTLRGLIPICSSCKKIRDDRGYWNQIDAYIEAHSEAMFTHGMCPQCIAELSQRSPAP